MNIEYIQKSLIYARDFNQGLYLTHEDVPELLGYLDALEASERMNRVHISKPIDLLDTTDSSREPIGSYMEFARDMVRHSYRPREIFVNNNTTVCKFPGGDVITSKPREGEPFDIEVGVAMCIVKKLYGGRGRWLSYLRDKVKYQERKVKK